MPSTPDDPAVEPDLPPSDPSESAAAEPAAVEPAAAAPPNPDDRRWLKVGVGVGSAALVAALLYSTRSKRKDWTE